jgi:uncharacterized damage-inducible protein DinB
LLPARTSGLFTQDELDENRPDSGEPAIRTTRQQERFTEGRGDMTQQTATEKDRFLETWDQEFQRTLRVLREYKPDKLDFKPHETSRSARDLGWIFPSIERVITELAEGDLRMMSPPPAPSTWQEILTAYENDHRRAVEKVKRMSDEDLNRTTPFPTGKDKRADIRRGELLWMFLMDKIHHRGQFSVYSRMVGAKVPAIYGPSGDESWM